MTNASSGHILTKGENSYGIFAQSVGGGGGDANAGVNKPEMLIKSALISPDAPKKAAMSKAVSMSSDGLFSNLTAQSTLLINGDLSASFSDKIPLPFGLTGTLSGKLDKKNGSPLSDDITGDLGGLVDKTLKDPIGKILNFFDNNGNSDQGSDNKGGNDASKQKETLFQKGVDLLAEKAGKITVDASINIGGVGGAGNVGGNVNVENRGTITTERHVRSWHPRAIGRRRRWCRFRVDECQHCHGEHWRRHRRYRRVGGGWRVGDRQ